MVEFEDFSWFPAVFRDGATDYLSMVSNTFNIDSVFTDALEKLIQNSQQKNIIDLCSGAGGPMPQIIKRLQSKKIKTEVLLTDKFPNQKQLEALSSVSDALSYSSVPIDAMDVELSGIRTLFNAFHHFSPEQATQILSNAVEKKQSIGIFEIIERKPGAFLSVLFAALGVFFLMPLITPRKRSNYLFTYIIPLIPLLVLWDGLASCCRAYSLDELHLMIKTIPQHQDYHWQITQKRLPYFIAKATVLIAYPKLK